VAFAVDGDAVATVGVVAHAVTLVPSSDTAPNETKSICRGFFMAGSLFCPGDGAR
jgi:hypothetical protein